MKIKLGLALLGIIGLFMFFSRPEINTVVPNGLIGYWKTTNPRYKDRFIEISNITIAFGTGKTSLDVNFITNVKKQHAGNQNFYTLYYTNTHKVTGKIALFYEKQDNVDVIRLKNNRNVIWRKTEKLTQTFYKIKKQK